MAFSFGTPAASQPAASSSGTSGFSFGQTPAQHQQQNKPASGGFSFGTPASQPQAQAGAPAAPATSSGGLFGGFGSSQPAAAAGSNAAAPGTQAAASTGGLFSFGAKPAGLTTSQPQQQPAAGATSTFGSGTGGLFGSTNTQTNTAGSGFSFGAQNNTASQPQQQQQQQQPSTTSLFGAPASSFATTSAQQPVAQTQFSAQPQQQQQGMAAQPDKKLGVSLSAKLEQIRAAWDTNNAAGCRFAYYFYNNAGNAQNLRMIQGRRPDAVGPMHDQLWTAAVRENPDPNRLYPVLALGFNDLKKRIESQAREAQRQRALLATLAQRLSALEQKHSLSNSVRTQAAQSRQAQLHHRLIGLAAKTQLLIPVLRGKSISPEEERLMAVLEACEAEITGSSNALASRSLALTPASNGGAAASGSVGMHATPVQHARLRARINELWAQLGVIRARREMLAREGRSATTEWAVVDQSGLDNVTRILAQQQQGLNHLSSTLEADTKTMDTITTGLTGVKLVGVSR
ncbi:nucleoporin nup44 [Moesziomyces antarcticus]|uniref:Related to NUP57 - nuclear pore protein n=2 Tax=Pseudozyma antarctica TaxID=84753 RepID=A0A5C3FLR9_PSEA2|nr:nucleoporin nup44 [Moesziomyces antarcticus]GAK64068.1 nucleoporin nup44 [Moesziomyces antarcticus]SPO44715.1 related to NUP57 - nuclear pore protein [Moesziomyces antarcticus]